MKLFIAGACFGMLLRMAGVELAMYTLTQRCMKERMCTGKTLIEEVLTWQPSLWEIAYRRFYFGS